MVAPVLYVATAILPGLIAGWKQRIAQNPATALFRPGSEALAYVANTAVQVASMIAATMIGETAAHFGEGEPAWWILTVVALFLGVLHLALSAFSN